MRKIIEEKIPNNLIEKIKEQYGNLSEEIFEGYITKRKVSFRINSLKNDRGILEKIKTEKVSWYEDAFVTDLTEQEIEKMEEYEMGKIYLQSLSSMLPPILLEPKEKKDILDMTAAPGGKTTEIAALTNNKAYITACELNKIRADRLRYNLKKQGANAVVLEKDARTLDSFLKFDQILLDAPCSGSGTISLNESSENIRFTLGFEEKLEKTQTKLLAKAIELLKKGEEMVYSTCSILERENENIINKFLDKVEIIPFDEEKFKDIKLLPCKIKGAMLVCPTEKYEGFFSVKLKKK